MILSRAALVRSAGEGRVIGITGDVYRFLATGTETDGKYALWEALVPPGSGPPPHIHTREEESFYVLEGEVTFYVGEERLVAGPGTFANIPVGTLHRFKNESGQPVRMLISVAPAGMEEMFFEVGQELSAGQTAVAPPSPAKIQRLLVAAPRYGGANRPAERVGQRLDYLRRRVPVVTILPLESAGSASLSGREARRLPGRRAFLASPILLN